MRCAIKSGIVPIVALFAGMATPAAATPMNIVQDPGFESAGTSGYVNAPSYLPDGVWQQTLGSGFGSECP